MRYQREIFIALTTLFAACLVAATEIKVGGPLNALKSYTYWIVRIGFEAAIFYFCYLAFMRMVSNFLKPIMVLSAAIIVSHIPFVLSVTAFDIILGFPELGIGSQEAIIEPRPWAFMLELLYLFDNHIALCLLVSVPVLMSGDVLNALARNWRYQEGASGADAENTALPLPNTLLSVIDPPLKGEVLRLEAQEHYVKVSTTEETRLVLSRFSDVIRELPVELGMQVHRSHWVAFSAIENASIEGQGVKITTKTGDSIPVSRSFRRNVEQHLSSKLGLKV